MMVLLILTRRTQSRLIDPHTLPLQSHPLPSFQRAGEPHPAHTHAQHGLIRGLLHAARGRQQPNARFRRRSRCTSAHATPNQAPGQRRLLGRILFSSLYPLSRTGSVRATTPSLKKVAVGGLQRTQKRIGMVLRISSRGDSKQSEKNVICTSGQTRASAPLDLAGFQKVDAVPGMWCMSKPARRCMEGH
jgi:hypothetical protein